MVSDLPIKCVSTVMDSKLHEKKCIPCEGGTKPLSPTEIEKYLKEVNPSQSRAGPSLGRVKGWQVSKDHKILSKNLHFLNFKQAWSMLNEIADTAEYENHHPDLNLHNWNQLEIKLSTHAIKGLSENDFIMAAKIDRLVEENKE